MKRIMPIALLGMAIVATPAFGDQAAQPARPGAVNYVEGNVYLDGRQLGPQSVGSADMDAGQELTTERGKAEILLTPGVFLRVGENSAVKMISPEILETQVQINRGRAAFEVDELHKENNLEVTTAGVTTHITKTGYYEFNADQPTVMVFKGEAQVDAGNGNFAKVKGSHQMALVEGAHAKSDKFDTDEAQDALYQWSSLRSHYLAEQNQQIAEQYAGVSGFTPGWYWNPYGYGYTFLGADPFFSPFGWGFYPPGWGFYGSYWGGPGYYVRPYRGFRAPIGGYGNHGFRGGVGDRGYGRGLQGGGVRGGMNGGFHPGGNFHGGAGARGGHR